MKTRAQSDGPRLRRHAWFLLAAMAALGAVSGKAGAEIVVGGNPRPDQITDALNALGIVYRTLPTGDPRASSLSPGDILFWLSDGGGSFALDNFQPFLNAGGDIILTGGSDTDQWRSWTSEYFNTTDTAQGWRYGTNPFTSFGRNNLASPLPSPYTFTRIEHRAHMQSFLGTTPNTFLYGYIGNPDVKAAVGAFREYANGGSFNYMALVLGHRTRDEEFIRQWVAASLDAAQNGLVADTVLAAGFDPPTVNGTSWGWLGEDSTPSFLAQTFTSSGSGRVQNIQFLFGESGGRRAPAQITLSIHEADGEPTFPLGSATAESLSLSSLPTPTYLTFDFSGAGITLVEGREYAIVVSPPADGGSMRAVGARNVFAGGQAFHSEDGGGTWANATGDFGFAVNIVPETISTLVERGASWRYLDNGSNLGAAWREPGFDDGAWAGGRAPLGYGDPDIVTGVGFGPNSNNKHVTTYFRRNFTVDELTEGSFATIGLRRDDGAAVYLNGQRVIVSNLPALAEIAFNTLALSAVGGAEELTYYPFLIEGTLLRPGLNTLAVEVHQAAPTSSDLVFDLEMILTLVTEVGPVERVLLADNFDISTNSNNVNSGLDTRQSGILAPVTSTKGHEPVFSQVGNSGAPNSLLLAGRTAGDPGAVSLDHDFIEAPGAGSAFVLSFDVNPVLLGAGVNQTQSSWVAVTLGASDGTRNLFPQFSDGIGIFFRGNGRWGAFNAGSSVGSGPFAPASDDLFHTIRIEITENSDGNPFDGNSAATVRAFADGAAEPFLTIDRPNGFQNNFISFIGEGEGSGGDGVVRHALDNLLILHQPLVPDGPGPTIQGAKDIVVNAPRGGTAMVGFGGVSASDADGLEIPVTCDPPDSVRFAVGTHEIVCTATDRFGRTATDRFRVHVLEIADSPRNRVLDARATSGNPAPGAGEAGTGIPEEAVFNHFNRTALNDSGGFVFEVILDGGGAGVLYTNISGTLLPIAVSTGGAPPEEEEFAAGIFSNLAVSDGGAVAFKALSDGLVTQYLADLGRGAVAWASAPAPQAEGALFSQLHTSALAGTRELFYPAHLLAGTGSPATDHMNDTGLWGTNRGLVAREGGPSPVPGFLYGHLYSRVVAGEDGRIAFATNLSPAPASALLAGLPNALGAVALRDDPAPGTDGSFASFRAESIGAGGEVVFRAGLRIGDGITTANNEGLWTNRGGTLALVAREGDSAPGLQPHAPAQFGRFADLHLCADGTVYFLAYLRGDGIDSGNDGSLWRSDPEGGLQLVAREEDPANNVDGWYRSLTGFVSNAGAGIAFAATIAGDAGDPDLERATGVWLEPGNGTVPELVLRRGDVFELEPGDLRAVTALGLGSEINPSGGAGGYGRQLSDAGILLLRLSFTGNASGVFLLDAGDQGDGAPDLSSAKTPPGRKLRRVPERSEQEVRGPKRIASRPAAPPTHPTEQRVTPLDRKTKTPATALQPETGKEIRPDRSSRDPRTAPGNPDGMTRQSDK